MAKKKLHRRANLSQETLERARAERRSEQLTGAATVTSTAASGSKIKRAGTPISAATRIPTNEELRQEYAHVIRDLRNLLILAGLLLMAIIVVSLMLPRPEG